MDADHDLVTVFRSADPSAEEDAAAVRDVLAEAGLNPVLLPDTEPGVPEGAVEVRVSSASEASALQLINEMHLAENGGLPADDSEDMDLVAVYEGAGTTGEVEAVSVRALLDSAGIPSVLIGVSPIPNLPFIVKVPRKMESVAREAIEVAKIGGAEAADIAERATEPRP
jgi:hypothetical protein